MFAKLIILSVAGCGIFIASRKYLMESPLSTRPIIVLCLISLLTAGFSYLQHENLYRFYMGKYFEFTGENKVYMDKSMKLYSEGKHKELDEYIEPLINVYPGNYKLKQIAGLNYIKLGREIEGAELFASSLEGGLVEGKELVLVARILFRNDHFGDMISFYDRGLMINDVNMAFYYGASLYQGGRWKEALERLNYAYKAGYSGYEIDYYMGLSMEESGDLSKAAFYMERAYNANRREKNIKLALLGIYRKAGHLKEAEVLFRAK